MFRYPLEMLQQSSECRCQVLKCALQGLQGGHLFAICDIEVEEIIAIMTKNW